MLNAGVCSIATLPVSLLACTRIRDVSARPFVFTVTFVLVEATVAHRRIGAVLEYRTYPQKEHTARPAWRPRNAFGQFELFQIGTKGGVIADRQVWLLTFGGRLSPPKLVGASIQASG